MTEENLTREDKEILRRRLELLQREYEKTAQRLQRAERREAVRRHVLNRISDQNRLLQINTSSFAQTNSAFSSASDSDLLSNETLTLETKPNDVLPKKIPLVRFHLPDESHASPCSTPCRRSPTHRLRSKRSRLRLQSREKESDTDSQEKVSDGVEERPTQENDQKKVGWKENESDKETDGSKQREEINSCVWSRLNIDAIPHSAAENSSKNELPVEVFPSQLEVKISPVGQSVDQDSQLNSAVSDQLLVQIQTGQSAGLSNQSKDHEEGAVSGVEKGCEVMRTVPFASEKTGFLDSCTLVEGLPFPVEYYVRTTRRMAAAQSPVDLDAVIHSQLSRGRGRRRSSQSQRQTGGHTTSEASQPGHDQLKHRGRGQRGRKGRRRTRTVGMTSSSVVSCTGGCSELQESLTASESATLQSQASFPIEPLPEAESASQAEPIPTLESASNTQPLAADFRHLSDSQLYLNCKLVPDSEVYPIFRRRCGRAGGPVLYSQAHTSTDDCTPLLPSLTSLIQALKTKDYRLLTSFDIQDFHLPDDEFGQLKLDRLRMFSSNVEPLIPHNSVYNTRHSSKHNTFRTCGNKGSPEAQCMEKELFFPEPLPPSSSLECSFPLSQMSSAEESVMTWNIDQSEKQTETANQLKSESGITGSGQEMDPGTEDLLQLSSAHQSDDYTTEKDDPQTSTGGLPTLQTSASEDKETNFCNEEHKSQRCEEIAGEPHIFLQTELQICRQNEAHSPSDDGTQCPVVLNLSMSFTSPTQCGPDSSLPSLGITPHLLTPTSLSVLPAISSSPFDQSAALCSSQLTECVVPAMVPATSSHTTSASGNVYIIPAQTHTQSQTPSGSEPGETIEPACDISVSSIKKSRLQNVSEHVHTNHNVASEKGDETKNKSEVEIQLQGINQYKNELHSIYEHDIPPQNESQSPNQSEPKSEEQFQSSALPPQHSQDVDIGSSSVTKPCTTTETSVLSDASDNQRIEGVKMFASDMTNHSHTPRKHITLGMSDPTHTVVQKADAGVLRPNQPVEAMDPSDEFDSCGTFQKIHTLKALEGGWVLDVCLVRWPSEDWCVCVAGEWSVCVWAQKAGVKQWNLLHTWSFTQSVISLQGVPDSAGLLSVSLGRLEITEARILCCPSIDGGFSQAELCKGALQAVVAVSECRVVCCSAPGGQQKVRVFTLTKDGSVADTLSLVYTNRSVQTLAAVENKKDALIGWTECKTLLIWNMKSGHLLQSIQLGETVSTAVCLKGYSYKGALCVLLQSASACEEKSGSALFTLIATNPLTGKYSTLISITSSALHTERLIDGDVCQSMLAGVFQSGHLIIWDLSRGEMSVLGGGEAQLCRLARWAGPDILLAGYLNGDVNLYQYKPAETKQSLHMTNF